MRSMKSSYISWNLLLTNVSSKDLKRFKTVVIMGLQGYVPSCDGSVLCCERDRERLARRVPVFFMFFFDMIAQQCARGYTDKKKRAADPGLPPGGGPVREALERITEDMSKVRPGACGGPFPEEGKAPIRR